MSLEILAKVLSYLCGGTPSPPKPTPIPSIPMTSTAPMVIHLPPSPTSQPQTNTTTTPRTIFIIGAPGTGKGTQSAFLVAAYGLRHLSYGDLMRRLRSDGDAVVSALETKPGTNNPAVPDDLGAWLIWKEIRRTRNGNNKHDSSSSSSSSSSSFSWLIDGFPRRVRQVEEWLDLLGPADLALYLKCPVDVSARRVAGRGEMAGAEARPEDLDSAVAGRRIGEFYKNADLVVGKLRERGIEVVEIDTDRSEVEIRRDLEKIMEGLGIRALPNLDGTELVGV